MRYFSIRKCWAVVVSFCLFLVIPQYTFGSEAGSISSSPDIKSDITDSENQSSKDSLRMSSMGWEQSTEGENLFEFGGEFDIGTGSDLKFARPDQLYIEPPKEIFDIAYTFYLRLVLKDRINFDVRFPIKYKFYEVPASSKLPGLVEYKSAVGLSNITFSSNLLVKDGLWNETSFLFLDLQVTTPWHSQFNKEDEPKTDLERLQEVPFALEGWSTYVGPRTTFLIGEMFLGKIATYYNYSKYDKRLSFTEKRKREVTENAFYLNVEPTFILPGEWKGHVGFGFTMISKKSKFENTSKSFLEANGIEEEDTVYNYEVFLEAPMKYRMVRYSFGVSIYGDDEEFYYYRLYIPIDFLDFKWPKLWF